MNAPMSAPSNSAVLALLLVVTAAWAAPPPSPPRPQWTVDLAAHARFNDDPEGIPAGVVFLTPERLLAYVVEKPSQVSLRPRGQYVGPDAPRLHLMLLDAATGRIISQHDLPATGYHALRVLPTDSGNFLVRLQNVLQFYSPGFRLLGQRDLPQLGQRDFWVVKVSSSGRTLWLYHDATHTVERFAAATLQPLSACVNVVMTDFSSVSDDKVLQEGRNGYTVRNSACDSAAVPKIVGHKARSAPLQCGMAHPLLGETEMAQAGCGRVTFTTLAGTVLGEDQFGWRNQVFVFPEVARNQQAAAFWTFQGKGSLASFFAAGGTPLKKSEIRVYDTAAYRLAVVLPLDPAVRLRSFALSPDSRHLAVMQGTTVTLFPLSHALSPPE